MQKIALSATFFVVIAAIIVTGAEAETYRLIHAVGNVEQEAGRGLSKSECEASKKELKIIAEAAGTYNEQLGYGSITCLPESVFAD